MTFSSRRRRSSARPGFFSSASFRTRITSLIVLLTASVAAPPGSADAPPTSRITAARPLMQASRVRPALLTSSMASLHLPVNVLADQLFQIEPRFRIPDPASRPEDFAAPPDRQRDIFFPNDPARLDRRNGVVIQLDVIADRQGDHAPVSIQLNPLHPPHLHARNLHRRAGLQSRDRIEFGFDIVTVAADDLQLPELDPQGAQTDNPHQHGHPDP